MNYWYSVHFSSPLDVYPLWVTMSTFFFFPQALKELKAKAQQKGALGGSGLKKSGKKWDPFSSVHFEHVSVLINFPGGFLCIIACIDVIFPWIWFPEYCAALSQNLGNSTYWSHKIWLWNLGFFEPRCEVLFCLCLFSSHLKLPFYYF